MNELQEAPTLAEVARQLDGSGITWAVFAGAAATAYGATRPLTDVDILVPAADGARVAALFPGAQVRRHEDGTLWIVLPGFDILAGLTSLDLDAQMAARLTRHKIAGVSVPVSPPEDNILLKAMWGRGADEGKHDWEDVEAMMSHLPTLDWDYLEWRAAAFARSHDVDRVLKRLGGLWRQQGKKKT